MSKSSVVLRVRFHVIGEFSGNLWFSTTVFRFSGIGFQGGNHGPPLFEKRGRLRMKHVVCYRLYVTFSRGGNADFGCNITLKRGQT